MNRLLSVSRCLIPAFATACLATGALAQMGPPPVGVTILNTPLPVTGTITTSGSVTATIANPATSPARTSSVDDPGRIAYQVLQSKSGCSNLCQIQFPDVPSGKRLVIQHVSGSLGFNGPPKSAVVNLAKDAVANSGVAAFFTSVAAGAGTNNFFSVFDQPVLFYIEAGKPTVLASGDESTISNMQVTLTGYLLDCAVNICAPIAP